MSNHTTVEGIKVILEPSVYPVGSQLVDWEYLEKFQRDHDVRDWVSNTFDAPQYLVEVAGRLCYMSFAKPRPGGNKAYIQHILEVGHGSVLEHAVYSLIITGVSRSLTHELVRHRAGMSYSQLSQRYVDESDVAFVLPPAMLDQYEAYQRCVGSSRHDMPNTVLFAGERLSKWMAHLKNSLVEYQACVEWNESFFAEPDNTLRRKQGREAARSVLPNCTETKIFVTGNARAWRHFLELRGSIHADAEMQRLARHVLRVLNQSSPHLFGDYVITDEGITTPYRKV
jgi:thymidylate synthase (FAD)